MFDLIGSLFGSSEEPKPNGAGNYTVEVTGDIDTKYRVEGAENWLHACLLTDAAITRKHGKVSVKIKASD